MMCATPKQSLKIHHIQVLGYEELGNYKVINKDSKTTLKLRKHKICRFFKSSEFENIFVQQVLGTL